MDIHTCAEDQHRTEKWARTSTHARVRKQAEEEERKERKKIAAAHFLLFHSKRNINFMSAVILIVMRPVFSTHYLSQYPFVLFHTVVAAEMAAPAAAAELSTTTTEKSWRGAKINALDLVFHNSIVVRIRHNVNVPRYGAGSWGKEIRLGRRALFVQHKAIASKNERVKTNAESKHKPTVVEKSLVYILLSLRAAHNRFVFRLPCAPHDSHSQHRTKTSDFRRCIRSTMTKHSQRIF